MRCQVGHFTTAGATRSADVIGEVPGRGLKDEAIVLGLESDIGQPRELGMPVMDIKTDAAPYFDIHHTANDTFDTVDPGVLRCLLMRRAGSNYRPHPSPPVPRPRSGPCP